MSSRGYCGSNYDRHVENNSPSRLHKMKETYWITKQAVIQKLGKKEDEHVVASDAELDAKLEMFAAIRTTTMTLLEVIEKYQNRLCTVAQDENAMGRFLKSNCSQDKTRAGKIMAAVGKSQSSSAQERLALRTPLVRLYSDVETFRYRAISDTLVTVHRMEGARTEYRGALLWMKKVSEELDPDMYRQLEKFRKVQSQVRKTKQRFDKLKLDVMQKIDLLAASRCNMFSHVLASYQTTLLHFWQRTSATMSAVADSFKGYQYYEFSMLKELRDTSRKLAEESNSQASSEQNDFFYDVEETSDEELIDVGEHQQQQQHQVGQKEVPMDRQHRQSGSQAFQEEERLLLHNEDTMQEKDSTMGKSQGQQKVKPEGEGEGDFGPFMEYQEEEEEALLMAELDKELRGTEAMMATLKSPADLQLMSLSPEDKDHTASAGASGGGVTTNTADKDDFSELNEIMDGAPPTGDEGFTQEWQAVFGAPMTMTPNTVPAERDLSRPQADFMPSMLLDADMALALGQPLDGEQKGTGMKGEGGGRPVASALHPLPSSTPPPPRAAPSSVTTPMMPSARASASAAAAAQEPKKDMSAWFSLLADLDPLSNPDAIGRENVMENL